VKLLENTAPRALAKNLGRNIGSSRRAAGLTQQQLAERVQVDALTISRYETGNILPPLTMVAAIGRVLHLSITELLKESPTPPDRNHTRIAVLLDGLTPEDRSWVEGVLKQLVKRCRNVPTAA
jgi:transcriptional regulator with XRE-family HTH domain